MRGGVGAWARVLSTQGFCCRALGGRGPHCRNSHLRRPLSYAHTCSGARAHLGHSHSASRDTRPRTCPPFTHAHARVHTRTHSRPPGHFPLHPTPACIPLKALIDYDTPTLIHRHTHSPHTWQPQTHIHKQGQEKYTRTPSPTLSGALSHSCPLPGLPTSLCAGTQAGLRHSLPSSPEPGGPLPEPPSLLCSLRHSAEDFLWVPGQG